MLQPLSTTPEDYLAKGRIMMCFRKCFSLCWAASVALSVSVAHANGFVAAGQDSIVKTGMGADAVRQAIGAPANVVRYANEAGPTWEYRARRNSRDANYLVQFGADGNVAST